MMAKDTFLNRKTTLNAKGKLVDLSSPTVMAILNITPDSFYNESRSQSVDDALFKTEKFLQEGGHMINDISGGELDMEMFQTVAKLDVPYILMHMKGSPQTMHIEPQYDDVLLEVIDYFVQKIAALRDLGVKDIILDPGFGFAKRRTHSYELLNHLEDLNIFGLSILVGVSRKSMIHQFLKTSPDEALNGTTVLNTIALLKGASILRVHDVQAAMECIKLLEKTQRR
jgi:dihydropteroate synthase